MDRPQPRLDAPYQPGITEPQWPSKPPSRVVRNEYLRDYAGQIDRQSHLHIVKADVRATTQKELREVLGAVTKFAVEEMKRRPSGRNIPALDEHPASYRVTITVGFGASLFLSRDGDDRFNLRSFKPRYLKIMPRFTGDSRDFSPQEQASDLIFLIASDHVYVNVYLVGLLVNGEVDARLLIRDVEQGYARPDNHESGGFVDGSSNPTNATPDREMDRLVYVQSQDGEPSWCTNGSYLAYRKVQQNLKAFLQHSMPEKQKIFGTEKNTGKRLKSRAHASHSFKLHPDRPETDLFDCRDSERRFLRRPYFYFQGVSPEGTELRGLHHLSFARDLKKQYEWPVLMWQTNPDFPVRGTGVDALYSITINVGGGYYFCPPSPRTLSDCFGSEMFSMYKRAHANAI